MNSPHDPSLLQKVLDSARSLPPFPNVMWKVMPLIRDMAPVHEIEAVIRFDPVITGKVVAISQSAHFARRHSIGSLRDAIVLLGQQQLIQVIAAACAVRYFEGNTAVGYDLRDGELWEHAVAVALMTEIVGRHLGREKILTAYTAALLHDIGKTVLNLYVKSAFDAILALVKDKGIRFLEAERQVLGIDHQQLGTMIAKQWQLPSEIITAIGFHHSPGTAQEHKDLVSLVYVADRMVVSLGIGCGVDGFLQPNQDEVFTDLGITERMVERFLADLVEALAGARQFLAS